MKKMVLWVVLPLVFVACAKPTSLDYLGIKNIRMLSFGFQESTVGADVQYYNPNKYPLTMKRAEVDVYINNTYLGKTTLDTTIHIPKKDTFLIPVHLRIDMKNANMNMLQDLAKQDVMVKLEGSARVGRSGIFINYPIKYEGMQRLKF